MIKNKIKIILIIVFALIMLNSENCNAETSNGDYKNITDILQMNRRDISTAKQSPDYIINDYQIDMIVNENNTFDITEKITVYFNVRKHGIYRKIPLKNTVTRLDGTKSNNIAKISNIEVNKEYTISNESGYKVIKIGDAYKKVEGSQTYTIKYTYDIGKDPLKNADELYYNLIGNEWDTDISNVTFKITMPKSFDKSQLGFSSGEKGLTGNYNVSYNVEENVISGSIKNTLSKGQALTVRLTLPEGYFVGARSNMDKNSIVVISISLASVLITIILWIIFGKDDEVIETVEFYPPEGYNSAEIGFLYEGKADTQSIISLLIYLANKGYLKIKEDKYDEFKITKLKEYDGDNENERIFFEGLFKKIDSDNKVEGKKIKSVTTSDLYDNFYKTLNKIKNNLNSKKNKNKIFKSPARGIVKGLIVIAVVLFCLITVKPILEYNTLDQELIMFYIFLPGSSLTLGVIFLIESLKKNEKKDKLEVMVLGIVFCVIPWMIMVLPSLVYIFNIMYLVMYIVVIVCIVIILSFVKIMPKRTTYGNEMLGKLRGFKRFLETAEKLELESLVEQNPEYFYNILPYTYALGVSDVWIKQFESIALEAPHWYNSHDEFSVHTFGEFMNSTMNSASTAMSSRPSSSSGGGSSSGGRSSSGGGYSGGGSGGGGGGSW